MSVCRVDILYVVVSPATENRQGLRLKNMKESDNN